MKAGSEIRAPVQLLDTFMVCLVCVRVLCVLCVLRVRCVVCVVRGVWCVVCGVWCVVWCVLRGRGCFGRLCFLERVGEEEELCVW